MKYLVSLLLSFFLLGCQTSLHEIAYITDRSGNFDIYATDNKGKNHRALTNNKGWDWYPKWNSNLEAIIYNSNDTSGQFFIKAMNSAGNPVPINTFDLPAFNLSPDGSKVLFVQKNDSYQFIVMRNLSDQTDKILVNHPSYNGRPKWAPNNKAFSFITNRDGNNEIYMYEIESGRENRITKTSLREKYTAWTEDSRSLVFYRTGHDVVA